MDKHKILEKKLRDVKKSIGIIEAPSNAAHKYLIEFENYVDILICSAKKKKIPDSNGALLGLIRGISDYDELCANKLLWETVLDVEKFYINDFDTL